MIVYRLRTRPAAGAPWSDTVSSAPLELLLEAARRALEDGAHGVRLEELGAARLVLALDVTPSPQG